MTDDQFHALAELLRLRAGAAQQVAHLVLVQGLSVPDAAREVGMSYRAAHAAVQRARAGLDLAERAAGQTPDPL